MEQGSLNIVERAVTSAEGRAPAVDEFLSLLEEAGFADINSWILPNALKFAESLQKDGIMSHMKPEDLLPCLRALMASSRISPGWVSDKVSCRKA